MDDLRAVSQNDTLLRNNFITTRFDIDLVEVTSQARQGGINRDLFSAPINTRIPLQFIKDNAVVHQLRPVEVYVENANQERVYPKMQMRTNQVWQLQRDNPGIAELSVLVDDIINLPDGDVVIDPSMTLYSKTEFSRDARLEYNTTTNYGAANSILLEGLGSDIDRFVFAIDIRDIGSKASVTDAKLNIKIKTNSLINNKYMQIYKLNQNWDPQEHLVHWSFPWTTKPGGDFSTFHPGTQKLIGSTNSGWQEFDITEPVKTHYNNGTDTDSIHLGYLFKSNTNFFSGESIEFYSKESGVADAWYVDIEFDVTHQLKFYKSSTVSASLSDIDDWIESGNDAIRDYDGTGDHVAMAKMWRDGSPSTLGTIEEINTPQDLSDVWSLLNGVSGDHKVYIVEKIIFNGDSVLGVALTPGNRIAIRNDLNYNSVAVAHELCHNLGVTHVCEKPDLTCGDYLMSWTINSTSNKLRSSDKTKLENN